MNAPFVPVEVILGAEAFRTIAARCFAMERLAVSEIVLAGLCETKFSNNWCIVPTYLSSDLVRSQVSHSAQ